MRRDKRLLARIYIEARIADYGYSVEAFRAEPEAVLAACNQSSAPECIERGYRPLLPAQAAVAERLRQQWASEQDTERVPEPGEGES